MAQFCRSIFQHHWTMVRIWASHERYFARWLQTFATPLNGRSAIRHGRCALPWLEPSTGLPWGGMAYHTYMFVSQRLRNLEKLAKCEKTWDHLLRFNESQWINDQYISGVSLTSTTFFHPSASLFFHHLSHGDPPAVPFRTACTAFRASWFFFRWPIDGCDPPTAFPNTGAHQCLTSGVYPNGAGSGEMVMEWWKFMEIPDQERFGPRLFHWSYFLRHVMIMIIYDKYPLVI